MPARPVVEEAGMPPKRIATDKLRSYGAADARLRHGRAPIAQGFDQPCRKLAPAAAKTGALQATVPLSGCVARFRQCLLRVPKSVRPGARSSIDVYLHRLKAIAIGRGVTGIVA
ncbi:UNVERIFIED_ORG: hypothetical protein GGE63_004934 [Rhizobium esperanzae]